MDFKSISLSFLIVFLMSTGLRAQLTPQDAVTAMGRGINMGNTLEPPAGEGTWGNSAATEASFDDYKKAGFTCVRLPITWDKYTSKTAPYKITDVWMNRIEQIVDWGLKRKLIIIINAHHDGWLKDSYTENNKARFDSIWSQIATRFKDKSDSLIFEILNEPHPMQLTQVNDLNKRVLQIIRKTNPTRNVIFSGHNYANSDELVVAEIPKDSFVIGSYHSYDPYPFGLEGPGTYGSDADIARTVAKFEQVANWSAKNHIPVILGEYGYTYKCEYNSRMCAYATVVEKAQIYGIPLMVWEDGGDFSFYNRNIHTWSEIKDVIINTYKESPNKLSIGIYADSFVKVRWNNRTTENDSIVVERKIGTGSFVKYKTIASTSNEFIDEATPAGKSYYYRLKTQLKDSIEIQSYPIMIAVPVITRKPYSGSAITIPGTIQCENFDQGKEGVSYHDLTIGNQGGSFRNSESVDIGGKLNDYFLQNLEPTEWLEYTIKPSKAAIYLITATVAATTSGGEFDLQFSNGHTTPFVVPATGGLEQFSKITNTFKVELGEQIMRLNILKTPEFNLDRLSFAVLTDVNMSKKKELTLYPNPSTDQVFIEGQSEAVLLKIYNLKGDLIQSNQLSENENRISIKNLDQGIYLVKIFSQNEIWTKRLIKN